MATSQPAPNPQSWTGDRNKYGDSKDMKTLQLGMSDLMSARGEGKNLKGSASTVSSSPDDREDGLHSSQGDTSSNKGSGPPSPSNDKHREGELRMGTRSVGSGVSMPSPIVKPGHSKNTSATSPLLTLTPNSSVDGNSSEWNSMGRQTSPFHAAEAPEMPYLNAEHHRGGTRDDGSLGFGSFDLLENDNDGLYGLEALRVRALSSPGPMSSEPHVSARGAFPSSSTSGHQDLPQIRRNATRDRPPLSQSYGEGMNHSTDRSVGISLPSSNRSVGESNNASTESGDLRGFGAIGRPELRLSASEFEPSRRRAASTGNFQAQYNGHLPGPAQDQVSNKFGSLPTLGSHIQQQRMPNRMGEIEKPRHVRSISQPVPAHYGHLQPYPPQGEGQFMGHHHILPHHGNRYGSDAGPPGMYNRSASVTLPAMPGSYENSQFQARRNPNNFVSGPGYQNAGYPSLQRRDALDFQPSPGSHPIGDDSRGYGNLSMLPHGHHSNFVGHSRQSSDANSAMLSSSPMSMNSGMMRGQANMVGRHHPHDSFGEEDLAHPLIGEHIQVPEHDDGNLHNDYAMNQGNSHPMMRLSSHTHSVSLDQIPPQLMEHLPTAGSALSMPQIVYSVKFKRTQRNFVLGSRINRDLKIGTYVKVEADRGEDLGIVVGKLPSEKFSYPSRNSFTAGMMPPPGGMGSSSVADLKRIIRLATHDEVSLLTLKREEEEELLKICRTKVRQRGLPMNVVDAEYQFDRHKLTFFFEAEGRVDFRELVRDLFSMYKTRIWMQQLDKNTSTSSPAIMSPHPSTFQIDYGTPIIAPASEFADSIVVNGLLGGDARSH